jgi:hypothetical protein
MDQDAHTMRRNKITQDSNDILGTLGGGEDPSSSFLDRGKAAGLEKGDQILVKEARENVVEEFSVVAVALDEVLKFPTVGEIAATFARQGQFDSYPAHFFQEKDLGSQFGCPPRSHETRGTPSDYNHVPFKFFNIHHRDTEEFYVIKKTPKTNCHPLESLFI